MPVMNEVKRPSVLFAPLPLSSLVLDNRFVRSATHEYMAEDGGEVTEAQVALYAALSEGEVGLIVTGHANVQAIGKASPRQTGAYDDRFVPGLARIARAVHDSGPSKVFLQIAHAGRQTKVRDAGGTPVSPSAVPDPVTGGTPRELSEAEIEGVIRDFAAAARRARAAGFDGVQVHAAHGYLLSSFLSPHTNRRTDGWGGPLPNRARIIIDIVARIKAAEGRSFPVIAKLNATDFLDHGLTLDDAVAAAQLLESAGLDGIEASGGMAEAGKGSVWKGLRAEADEGYFVDNAAAVKRAVRLPVAGLGGLRTFAVAERLVADGRVDLVSMSRPFIRDPGLVRRFRAGEVAMSDCISCNRCFDPRGIRCRKE